MGELVLALVPLAIGVVLSPLAIMALVAVLLSARARVNGLMYLLGWAAAITVILAISYGWLGGLARNPAPVTPVWISVVHILLGGVLGAAGVWEYRKGRAVLHQMARAASPADVVAAAPQLPGWLTAVATFTAARSLALGFGIFAFNPVDLSCAVIAGLDTRSAGLPPTTSVTVLVVFGIVALLPIAVPVALLLILGRQAEPILTRARSWIASHNGLISAGMLLVIGALQLQKGLAALLS